MLKRFFSKNAEPENGTSKERQIHIEGQDEHVQEAMDLLAQEDQDDLDEALDEVNETVREAARASLRDLRLMQEGHCPSCGHKTLRQFLFTTVCFQLRLVFIYLARRRPISHPPAKVGVSSNAAPHSTPKATLYSASQMALFAPKFQKKMSNTSNFPGPKKKSSANANPAQKRKREYVAGAKKRSQMMVMKISLSMRPSAPPRCAMSSVQTNAMKPSKNNTPFAFTKIATNAPASIATCATNATWAKTRPFSNCSSKGKSDKAVTHQPKKSVPHRNNTRWGTFIMSSKPLCIKSFTRVQIHPTLSRLSP